MLKLICGPSGSGKTTLLTEAIRRDVEAGIRSFLLVPEQQAYISERDLPSKLPRNAGLYFEIVNFSGLADDVFREYGGVTHRDTDGGTRALLMWETLRSLSPLLKRYGRSARGDLSLTGEMLRVAEELKSNGVSPETLEKASAKLPDPSPLRNKLSDLSMILSAFDAQIASSFGESTPDKLLRMASLLEKHRYFVNCHLYIDSFTGFTVPEQRVLREILAQADCVTVALCTDGIASRLMHFEPISETARALKRLADQAGVPVEQQILSGEQNKRPEALRLLERNLWRFDLPKKDLRIPTDHGKDTVHLFTCSNIYEESELAALNILRLVQGGMHYGDIALVVRDTETYRGVLDAALERYGIPYFLSERTDLSSKPLSRMILSALRAVGKNYRTQDILTLLKTGLCGVEPRDVALFEEYCETWHISGSRFCDPVWNMNPDGLTTERSERADEILETANRVRKAVMEPLRTLAAELRASDRVPDRCRAVYRYLCRQNLAGILSDRAASELALGEIREAGETVRLYTFVTGALTSLCDLLPDAQMTVEEFTTALSILFSSSDIGSVPNVHDCVMIGSADSLRVENVRASLLLGLCEGEFPRAVSDSGILTESDKDTLEALGIRMDSRLRRHSSEELFYVYRAMTKPKEQLFLSAPLMQTDGSERMPSLALTRVCYLLDRKPDVFDIERIRNVGTSEETLPENPFRVPAKPSGSVLSLSQTSIQAFASCPYRYYSTYQLHVREKKDSSPTYADDGIFLHFVFEQFLRSAIREDGSFDLLSDEEIAPTADRIIARYLDEVCPVPPERMDARLLHLFERLRGLSVIMLRDMIGEIRASRFRPSAFEQVIGGKEEHDLPAVTLTLRDGSTVRLRGKVDRVDLYRSESGKTYVRVVDYKSGMHKFSPDDVRTGMDIQLLLYLYAATHFRQDEFLPAGAQFLYSSRSGGVPTVAREGFLLNDAEIIEAADASGGQYTGKLSKQTADEIRQLTDEMKDAVCDVAGRILSGDVEKTPSERGCRFCPIRGNCDRAYREKR